jgi:hypothetical protein
MIEKGETYWVHDFDAYQLEPFDLKMERDAAFTTYGWSKKWCLGSYFFKDTAADIFTLIKNNIYVRKIEDERALVFMTNNNLVDRGRFDVLNITYNFGMRHVEKNYFISELPIKVLHFHPWGRAINTLDIFMYGKNGLNKPLMTDSLIEVFHAHGVK